MLIMKSKGNAILTAIFITTLVAITTTAIMRHLKINITRTEKFISTHELYFAAQLVPFWATSQLKQQKSIPTTPTKSGLVLTLPKNLQNLYPGVKITGNLYDLQSKFNINNISDAKMQSIFFKLIQETDPSLEPNLIKSLISAILQWITPNNKNGNDKWSQYYKSLKTPYIPAGQLLRSPYELNLIAGVNQTLFAKIAPFITTLPEVTPININTASEKLLKTLNQDDNNDALTNIISLRKEKGMLSQQDFSDAITNLKIDLSTVTMESKYFISIAKVSKGSSTLTLYSVLKRTPIKNNINEQAPFWQVSLIKQSINASL